MWSCWKEYSETMKLRKKKKLCFKDFLIGQIESQVNELQHLNFHKGHGHGDEEEHSHEELPKAKVACVNLAYDNSHL